MKRAFVILIGCLTVPLMALEIRIHPGQKELYLYEVDARRGISTAMIQNLAVVNGAEEPAVRLSQLRIELRTGDRVRQSVVFSSEELATAGARMASLQKAGVLDLLEFAFQRKQYLGEKTTLAESETVGADSALMLIAIPLLVPRGVDSVNIEVSGSTAEGNVSASTRVPVTFYAQKNDYQFPMNGNWVVVVGPGLSEPHRWALNEEFALDIVRIGSSGRTCGGKCAGMSDYYAWGHDVLAAADGVVVSTVTNQKENPERLRQPGEASEVFMERTQMAQMQLLAGGTPAVAGNLVVIRHEGGEYSHYSHLAEGSVVVKPGEKVSRGQKIGKLGGSGNSTEPHLHFGVSDGPDPLYARSLPIRISGLTTVDGAQPPAYVQSGWIVDAKAGN